MVVCSLSFAHRRTALLLAAERGMRALVQALVAKGASALARNVYQRTPLMEAAVNLEADVVKDLLVATFNGKRVDVDLEGKDEQGKTALHLAAEYGAETVVQACTHPRTTWSVFQADSSSQASPLPGSLHSLYRDTCRPWLKQAPTWRASMRRCVFGRTCGHKRVRSRESKNAPHPCFLWSQTGAEH